MKKLIPALALLVVSAILMGTSTFAWFSLNNKVSVTGMTVSTHIGDSLQIAASTIGKTTTEDAASFKNGLDQEVTGLLEPVSTINGENFYYTSTGNVQADGNAINDTYTAYASGDTFDKNYGVDSHADQADAVGYVDYVFQVKATNTGSTAYLNLTKVNLLYNGAAATASEYNEVRAFRVAVFAQKTTFTATTATATNLKTIIGHTNSAYFNTASYAVGEDTAGEASGTDGLYQYLASKLYGNAATAGACTKFYSTNSLETAADLTACVTTASGSAAATETTGQKMAVNGASTLANVATYGTAANIGEVTATSTEYFKVVVRMWLEGEDTTCNNTTYLALTKNWTLDLALELQNSTGGVTNIGSTAIAASRDGLTGTVTLSGTPSALSNGEIPETYKWHDASDDTAATGTNNTVSYTAGSAGDFYCVITTTKGNVYRTPVLHLAA